MNCRFALVLAMTVLVPTRGVFVNNYGDNTKGNYYFKYDIDHPEHNLIARHWEMKRGELIRGGYSFLQPDNRVRTVEYVVEGRKGLRAAVDYRKPPGSFRRGHLEYPKQFSSPVWQQQPVGYITPDLFHARMSYPNLPT